MATFKELTDFFRTVGADEVAHSEKTYLAHAIGVYQDMKAWGAEGELCRAALFHSIYGTELFQRFALPLERRNELRQLIGDRAERLAYLNCAMDRPAFDADMFRTTGPWRLRDRFTGEDHPLSEAEFADLTRLHLCDWLEQVERSQNWDYRREAYRQMARRLGGVAEASYERVFSNEPAPTG
ncbi:MAG: hypothetical protein KY476_22445 [Planctomycetes bacterium]|nr:hypothetical protein [Planctomycetota bacterium]